MDRTIVVTIVLFVLVALGAGFMMANSGSEPAKTAVLPISAEDASTVYFFYGEECPHCHKVMPFIQNLSKKYPDFKFRILETWHNDENQALFNAVNKRLGDTDTGVPEVVVGSVVLIGEKDIPDKLESVLVGLGKKK
jgi:thiol-disulfide isomerase/thioredoxin